MDARKNYYKELAPFVGNYYRVIPAVAYNESFVCVGPAYYLKSIEYLKTISIFEFKPIAL
jgi:hypothetical protein